MFRRFKFWKHFRQEGVADSGYLQETPDARFFNRHTLSFYLRVKAVTSHIQKFQFIHDEVNATDIIVHIEESMSEGGTSTTYMLFKSTHSAQVPKFPQVIVHGMMSPFNEMGSIS